MFRERLEFSEAILKEKSIVESTLLEAINATKSQTADVEVGLKKLHRSELVAKNREIASLNEALSEAKLSLKRYF